LSEILDSILGDLPGDTVLKFASTPPGHDRLKITTRLILDQGYSLTSLIKQLCVLEEFAESCTWESSLLLSHIEGKLQEGVEEQCLANVLCFSPHIPCLAK
jgi:hypothetical protein